MEGAEPGDLLKLKIVSIDVKDRGVAAVVPDEGVLETRLLSLLLG